VLRKNEDNIVLIEGMSPKGHILFNRFLIKILNNKKITAVLGSSIYKSYEQLDIDLIKFDDSFQFSNRIILTTGFLKISLKTLFDSKKNGVKKIYFLSYDLIALPIISFIALLLDLEIFVFEHNTIPNKFLKKVFQYFNFGKVTRICFTPSAVEIFRNINQKTISVNHPILNHKITSEENLSYQTLKIKKKLKTYEIVIFCPSGQSSIIDIEEKAKSYKNMLFIAKSDQRSDLENLITENYFQDYSYVMSLSDFIYLPFDYGSRISGPFFEAIFFNKKSILSNNIFRHFTLKEFNEFVLKEEDDWNDFSKLKNKKFDLKKYNRKSKIQLVKIFE
tara:strand:- start:11386 stop:12387 length:1002 start_codon:yes stop_codon:yes gene_type:complete